jgi:hypothetical protein
MTARNGTATRTRAGKKSGKPPRILVFGESENDTKLIHELIIGLIPQAEGMVRTIRRPPVLIRDCDATRLPERINTICRLIEVERTTGDVICVFAHEDCDDVEPSHSALSEKIESAFAAAGHQVHAVTPAWETETWLFLWPDAVASHRPTWTKLTKYKGKEVGKIRNAKEELSRALRPKAQGAKHRDYRETDAPLIAKKVRELGLADKPSGKSASYDAFREKVKACGCRGITTSG